MALFGKKKQDENNSADKNEAVQQSKEMDIILQARQEEEEARQARIAEREAEQEWLPVQGGVVSLFQKNV